MEAVELIYFVEMSFVRNVILLFLLPFFHYNNLMFHLSFFFILNLNFVNIFPEYKNNQCGYLNEENPNRGLVTDILKHFLYKLVIVV